jgi:hypothetical protein
MRRLIREAAMETGFFKYEPVLDAEGKPTGETTKVVVEEGEKGYLKWLAQEHPAQFASLYGRLVPFELQANVKTEPPPKVVYATVEETRAALIARRIDPDVLERAMMPPWPLPKPLPRPGSEK